MTKPLISSALALSLLVAGLSAYAGDSEMDGKATKRPAVLIQKADAKAKTITTYALKTMDPEMTEESLEKLSKEERAAKVEAFLKKNAVEANWVKTEPLKTADLSEMDKDKSTAACGWGWRGWRGGCCGWGWGGWGWGAGWGWTGGWGWGGGCGWGWNVVYW